MRDSPGDVGDVPMMYLNQRKGCRMNSDVGEASYSKLLSLKVATVLDSC